MRGKRGNYTNFATATEEQQVTVEPGQHKEVLLGIYERGIPQPLLRVQLATEEAGPIHGWLRRVEEQGDYSLIYELQNDTTAPLTALLGTVEAA